MMWFVIGAFASVFVIATFTIVIYWVWNDFYRRPPNDS